MEEDDGKDGGYDCDLVEEPPDDLVCPICLLPPKKPHLISCCGRKLCQTCVSKIKEAGQSCPCCRGNEYIIVIDKQVERRVLDLKVYCKYKSIGCTWSGELRNLEKHVKTCNFKLIAEKNEIIEKQAQKIKELENNIAAVQKENKSLEMRLKECEPQPHAPIADKVNKSICNAVQMACEDLGERLKAEQKVNQTQKKKIQECERRVALVQEEYERMATENATLQKKLKKSGSNTPTNAYPNEKAKLEHELEQFQLMHDRKTLEKNETLANQAEEMKTLEEEARKLQDQLARMTQQETAMKKSIQTLNVENEQLKRELRELKQQQAAQPPKYTPSDVPPPPYGQGNYRVIHPPPPQHTGCAPPTQPLQAMQLYDKGDINMRTCPMCNLPFPDTASQTNFEKHVNSHFRN